MEYQTQLGEYKRLLDLRAARIQKLESQLRQQAYGKIVLKSMNDNLGQEATSRTDATDRNNDAVMLHTPSGHSMFEVHIAKVG